MRPTEYRYLHILAAIVVVLLAIACGGQKAEESTKLEVYTAVPPVAWLAGQIGGEHVNVHVLIDLGSDPHTFEPTPRQVTELGNAELFLLGRLPLEQRIMARIEGSDARVKIVDITAGIAVEEHTDDETTEGITHAASDPHVWLSPRNLKALTDNIADAFIAADPKNSQAYHAGVFELRRKIDDLQIEITELLSPFEGSAVYVQHPAFGTFLEEFGLRQKSMEGGSRNVSARHLNDLVEAARAEGVRAIFAQPQFSDRGARTVANAIGAEVRHLDPLVEDVLANLRAMATAIRDELASRAGRENR